MKNIYVLFLILFCFPAEAMPDKTQINVNYHADEINYIHENNEVECSQNKQGGVVLGCARDKKKITMQVDCENRQINVDIFSSNREIEIHGEIPKDSCEYEEVLDHELTHMDLHVDALENILNQGMIDVVDSFNRHFNNGRGCPEATQAARKTFDEFVRKYQREDKRINQDFDRDDVDSVLQNCKTPPMVEVLYTQPEVKYSSVKNVKCSREKVQCSLEKGKQLCSVMDLLSCTDIPVSYKTEIKTYLGLVSIVVSVPEIKTKISSRYPVSSCEYKMLKEFELKAIDAVEDVIYSFKDTVIPVVEKVYNRALEEEYSGEELNNAVTKVIQKHINQVGEQIATAESMFRPLTERELRKKCRRK